jgi:hypothetical protein
MLNHTSWPGAQAGRLNISLRIFAVGLQLSDAIPSVRRRLACAGISNSPVSRDWRLNQFSPEKDAIATNRLHQGGSESLPALLLSTEIFQNPTFHSSNSSESHKNQHRSIPIGMCTGGVFTIWQRACHGDFVAEMTVQTNFWVPIRRKLHGSKEALTNHAPCKPVLSGLAAARSRTDLPRVVGIALTAIPQRNARAHRRPQRTD